MSTKIFIAWLLGSSWAWGFIPPTAFVLEQIIKKNPLKNVATTQFNAMISEGENKEFAKLALNSQGLSDGQALVDLYSLNVLIKSKTLDALRSYLNEIGLDMNVISLGFFGNEPVYIVGAQPGDMKSTQLWVDKGNWLIVKEINKSREVIFDKWQSLSSRGANKFPRLIQLKIGNEIKNYAVAEVP